MAKHLRYLGMRRPSHDLGGKRPPEGGFPAHGPFEDVVPGPLEVKGIHLTRQKIAFVHETEIIQRSLSAKASREDRNRSWRRILFGLTGSVFIGESQNQVADRLEQLRDVHRGRPPEDLEVHSEVLVDDDVPHIRDVYPRDLRPALSDVLRNRPGRLADDRRCS